MSEKYSNSSSKHMDNTSIHENSSNGNKQLQRQFRQVSKILFIGLVLVIAPVVFMSSNMLYANGNSNGDSYLAFGQSEDNDNNNDAGETSTLPQPNDNDTLINVEASNALFEPAAGLSNVFGPGGLFPFDNFNCADALTCGVSAGENAEFTGTFEKRKHKQYDKL